MISYLGLPVILDKLLYDFLDEKRERISLGRVLREDFELECGVLQGSVLSPTLFIIYTNDTNPPVRGNRIVYADDVTQIVGYSGKSKRMVQLETLRSTHKGAKRL